jgi:NTE family protein
MGYPGRLAENQRRSPTPATHRTIGAPRIPDGERTAFVLGGGGGPLGAHEVGMLRALVERGIRPDLVLGTSIGAINGAAVAADPSAAGVGRLTEMWTAIDRSDVLGGSVLGRLATLARTRTHLHDNAPLRALLADGLADRFEELAVPFQCVAASIERACEHWFAGGPLVDAVLASAAVPGILPPVEIGGEHFIDGGIVNSIPVSRAVELGATRIFVLHVGRLDRPLEPPRWPWEVGLVAFEIARRHRFIGDLAALPEALEVHVLPTGQQDPPRYTDLSQFRYRDTALVTDRIGRAAEATARYLDAHELA